MTRISVTLEDLLAILKVDIDDLAEWSAYSDDQLNEEIYELEQVFEKIQEKAETLKKANP